MLYTSYLIVIKENNGNFYALNTPAGGAASVICLTVHAALHYQYALKYISLLAYLTAIFLTTGH